MASSEEEGFLTGTPFLTENVDILHEYLRVSVGDDYHELNVHVIYEIKSNGNDTILPIVFYALNYEKEFQISIDGNLIELSKFYSNGNENVEYNNDIRMMFQGEKEPFRMARNSSRNIYLSKKDMKFFYLPITNGKHSIEVDYVARPYVEKGNWVKEYFFMYLISPAKKWRSFGGLTLEVEIQKENTKQFLSYGNRNYIEIDKNITKEYKSIPGDLLLVKYQQKLSDKAQQLIDYGPFKLALSDGIIVALIHIIFVMLIFLFYTKKKWVKHILIWVGSCFVILYFEYSWVNYYDFIFAVIGPESGRYYGVGYLILFLIPLGILLLILYSLFLYIILYFQLKLLNKNPTNIKN